MGDTEGAVMALIRYGKAGELRCDKALDTLQAHFFRL